MTTETAIAKVEPAEIELVKKTIAQGATTEELNLFLFDCKRQGVHPLDKLIHFSKRGGKYTPITSIDFMRMRAAETGEMAGSDEPSFTFKDGEMVIPVTATVVVYRLTQGQRYPYTATARWSEYLPPKGQDFMWLKMPQTMLGKCAEALALRKAFPKQLHGMYEAAEMMQAAQEGGESSHNGPAKVIASRTMERPEPQPGAPDEADGLFPDPEADVERERLLNEIKRLANNIKLPAKERTDAWITYIGKDVTPSSADPAALHDLVKWLETRQPK